MAVTSSLRAARRKSERHDDERKGKDDYDASIGLSVLMQHNTAQDAWIAVHGSVYDITHWAGQHPGGDIILLGAGTDCTVMFEMYHPAGVPSSLLRKFRIGHLQQQQHSPSSPPPPSSLGSYYDWEHDRFYKTLKKRVVEVLAKRGGRHDSFAMYFKTALILALFFVSWYFAMIHGSFLAAVFLGVAASLIGMCVMHDACHGSYSRSPWVNTICAMGMDLIGASTFVWEVHHNCGHHPYTNLLTGAEQDVGVRSASIARHTNHENDPDVFSSYPLLRLCPTAHRAW